MSHAFESFLPAALEAVATAAEITRRVQANVHVIGEHTKDDRSPVTVADYAAQAIVSLVLEGAGLSTSDRLIVGEEDAADEGRCTSLYYEGNEDEITVEEALQLQRMGMIADDTLVYSDQDAFPYDGWTAWSDCRLLFVPSSSDEQQLCTTLYYDGDEDEITVEQALALVEAETITGETQIFSNDDAFIYDGWKGVSPVVSDLSLKS